MATGVSILLVPTIGSAQTINEADVVAWWSCDEESGTRVDSSANANDLTDNNSVLFGTGKISNACDFESTNSEYLSIADASQTGLDLLGDWTWSGWIWLESNTGGDPLMEKWLDSTTRSIALQYQTTPRIILYHSNNGTTQGSCDISTTLNTSTWYHLSISYDISAADLHLYVNGSNVGDDLSGCFTVTYDNSNPFYLGRSTASGTYLDGLLDEVVITNTVLTSTEITELYNSGNGISYNDYFNPTSTTTSTTTTTTTTDVSELIWVVELYLSMMLFLIFTYIGYRFTKLFI